MRRRARTQNRRLTGEQRAQFARSRQKLIGSLITQKGFEAYLVLEHIRGSQYLVRTPDGEEVFMSHKKPKYNPGTRSFITEGGWSLWENRSESR
jgi:hypothetical protein